MIAVTDSPFIEHPFPGELTQMESPYFKDIPLHIISYPVAHPLYKSTAQSFLIRETNEPLDRLMGVEGNYEILIQLQGPRALQRLQKQVRRITYYDPQILGRIRPADWWRIARVVGKKRVVLQKIHSILRPYYPEDS